MLFEIFSGRGKTRKSSLCLPYPNSPSVCALFRCEVNAENISFFYCMESTCWDGHIFIEVSGWLLVSKLCLCGLHPAEVVQLSWSTQAQLLHGLWGHCPLPLGPPVMGRWTVLGCFILFFPKIQPADLNQNWDLSQVLAWTCWPWSVPDTSCFFTRTMKWTPAPERLPLLLEEPTDSGGPYPAQSETSLAFFHVHV